MKQISLRLKLSIIMLVLIFIESILIGYISFSNTKGLAVLNKKQEIKDTVNRIDINMNVKTRFLMDSLNNWIDKQELLDIVKENKLGMYRENILEYKEHIETITGSEIGIIINTLEHGIHIYGEGFINKSEIEKINSLLEDKKHSLLWLGKFNYQDKKVNKNFVRLAKALFDNDKYLGFILVDVDVSMIGNLLESNRNLYEYQYIFTLDKNDNLVSSSTSIDESLYKQVSKRFKNGERQFRIEYNRNIYYVAGQYNGITGWVNYEMIRDEALFPNSKELIENIFITVIISIIVIGVFIFIFTYALLKPIEKLSTAMEMVCNENFSVRLAPKSKDEISNLFISFNFMLDKINILMNEVYNEKFAKKEAELKALQAQINPHFLYNTLDAINWMLIEKGEMEISENIISVGRIIRYCIDDSKSFVTIAEELEYVKAYLKIQKNRLEERIDFEITIDSDIEKEEIPKLILQPLVENSLIHGIEPFKDKGVIKIRIAKQKEKLYFSIEDNGKGIQEDILDNIVNNKSIMRNNKSRIGLKNIIKRLKLYYGSEYNFIISTDVGKGTKIELILPKRSKA